MAAEHTEGTELKRIFCSHVRPGHVWRCYASGAVPGCVHAADLSSVAIFGFVEIGKKKPPQMRRLVC